eukprot:m51a1_g992 hypothetical protein (336) ;mRNA; r:500522-503228
MVFMGQEFGDRRSFHFEFYWGTDSSLKEYYCDPEDHLHCSRDSQKVFRWTEALIDFRHRHPMWSTWKGFGFGEAVLGNLERLRSSAARALAGSTAVADDLRALPVADASRALASAPGALLAPPPPRSLRFCWLGHSSVALQVRGCAVLFDPVWAASLKGSVRIAPQPPPVAALGAVSAVLVSHNHYDHLDQSAVLELARTYDPLFLVPRGLAPWFRERGMLKVRELSWWEETEMGVSGLRAAFVPAQHWSGRSLLDYNKVLWYLVQQHVGPGDAIKIHKDVRSRRSIGIHWGTYSHGVDLPGSAPRGLALEVAKCDPRPDFTTVPIGELVSLPLG